MGGENATFSPAVSSTAPAETLQQPDENSIDGEPMTAEEWGAVKAAMAAEEAVRKKELAARPDLGGRRPREPKKRTSGTWTQVWDAGTDHTASPEAAVPGGAVIVGSTEDVEDARISFKQPRRFTESEGNTA